MLVSMKRRATLSLQAVGVELIATDALSTRVASPGQAAQCFEFGLQALFAGGELLKLVAYHLIKALAHGLRSLAGAFDDFLVSGKGDVLSRPVDSTHFYELTGHVSRWEGSKQAARGQPFARACWGLKPRPRSRGA